MIRLESHQNLLNEQCRLQANFVIETDEKTGTIMGRNRRSMCRVLEEVAGIPLGSCEATAPLERPDSARFLTIVLHTQAVVSSLRPTRHNNPKPLLRGPDQHTDTRKHRQQTTHNESQMGDTARSTRLPPSTTTSPNQYRHCLEENLIGLAGTQQRQILQEFRVHVSGTPLRSQRSR